MADEAPLPSRTDHKWFSVGDTSCGFIQKSIEVFLRQASALAAARNFGLSALFLPPAKKNDMSDKRETRRKVEQAHRSDPKDAEEVLEQIEEAAGDRDG